MSIATRPRSGSAERYHYLISLRPGSRSKGRRTAIDIQRFFASIDHELILKRDRTTPVEWRWLRDCFIDAEQPAGAVEPVTFHFSGDELFTPLSRRHGMPLGSLTS